MSPLATEPRREPASQTPPAPASRGVLFVGGVAAILASACCLGPLVLLLLGFSGAWIGNLTALDPYRPLFVLAAVVALYFAYRQIVRRAVACAPGEVCTVPQVRTAYKVLFWLVAALTLIAVGFPFIAPLLY